MKLQKISYGGNDISLAELVIIVGPNGVGKTTFLRELHEQFKNSTSTSNWSTQDTKWRGILEGEFFHSTKSEWQDWVGKVVKVEGIEANNQAAYAVGDSMSHEERGEYIYDNERQGLSAYLSENNPPDLEYLETHYGKPFKGQHSHLLSVDNRFYLANNSGGQLRMGYANDLKPAPFLALNKPILTRINKLLGSLFGKQLYVEPNDHPDYFIYVAKQGTKGPKRGSSTTEGIIKSKEYFKVWRELPEITTLTNEGHGIRAAAEIIYTLENARKKILFIDEPELHLYPSTKYNLGRIISSYSGRNKQVVLVTHDTEILRGLLHGTTNATVIRINSDKTTDTKSIKAISSSDIKKSYSADILQAAFQDCVLLVEGIDDKYVYGKAIAEKHLADELSMQVVSMYGKDSLSVPIKFYEQIAVSHAVIADFDILKSDKHGMKHVTYILKAQNSPQSVITNIETKVDGVRAILSGKPHSNKGLNTEGVNGADQVKITELLESLKIHGIFIVPIGALEDWVGLAHEATPEKVFATYRARSNSTYKPMTDFLQEVVGYMKK